MTLADNVKALTDTLNLDLAEFLEYASEDQHTGWDQGQGDWPVGSIWRVEGVILYALVRALKPTAVLELGTWHGCSATHMLEALKKNRKKASLLSVDNHIEASGPDEIGGMIPADLRKRWEYEDSDIMDFVTTTRRKFDLIFEDGFHDPASVEAVWSAAPSLLRPGGVIVSHDATHFIVGADIQAGIIAAGVGDALVFDTPPSDCGLAVWRMAE